LESEIFASLQFESLLFYNHLHLLLEEKFANVCKQNFDDNIERET